MMLKDDVVIVSGVGAGLGAKLATRAAAEGAKVVMAARSTEVMDQTAKEIAAAGGEAITVPCDVRKPEDVERVVAAGVEQFGTITGLVNSAYSHPGFTDLLETPDKQLRRAMDVILFGGLEMARATVPHMTNGGSIVNVGTMSTRRPLRGEAGYAVAKSALGMASQYMALELGEKGITEQEVYDDIASNIPVGRIPTDEACAGAILYLLSPFASEVTGATLDVNGGEFMPT